MGMMVDGFCYANIIYTGSIKPNLVKKALKRSAFTSMECVKSQKP